MDELTKKDIEYAVSCLKSIAGRHRFTQPQLAQLSGVNQSTISKLFSGAASASPEVLRKLCRAVGLKIADVLPGTADSCHDFCGYLATPLTGLKSENEPELERVVQQIKAVARQFEKPAFDIYWPGDYTHPTRNPDFNALQVYSLDRLRASTNDFVILLCASPSYGVGQENEIATQAGLPMIRIVPEKVSRMISGSFANAIEVIFEGSVEGGIALDEKELSSALEKVRVTLFKHRALYRNMRTESFGSRLKKLIDERTAGYMRFADDVGISLSYVHALMEEELAVSNPGTQLLRRIASVLDTSVGYLLGEREEADPVWIESRAYWRKWIDSSPVNAAIAMNLWDDWAHEHKLQQNQPAIASFRKTTGPITTEEWNNRYHKRLKKEAGANDDQLF